MEQRVTGYIRQRIFSIEPGLPFLNTLAAALCEGQIVEGFSFDGNPMTLARATIFVPTRRAARELRSAFMDHLGQQSVLLPVIKTLGEFDEDAALFEADAGTFIQTPPPVESLERQLMLGQFIAGWTKHLEAHLRHYFDGEEFTTPVSTADAFWMARDLADLLDQLQTEDISFDEIQAAAEAETSDWWQITLSFLQIIKDEWPNILAERKRIDPAKHRNLMLRGEAARLAKAQPVDPVIVAGSTGTIPATADLIATIAKLPAGAVVLPGYDMTLSAATLNSWESDDDLGSAIGHPQYGMHRLVQKMGAVGLVEPLGAEVAASLNARKSWVAAALEPAPGTQDWHTIRPTIADEAFDGVSIMVAANERQEASAIAVAMREAIADPSKKVALVTPDRVLARRVVTELKRYGIEADDSGGTPFEATVHGTLVSLVLKFSFASQKDPADLLAILKSRLVSVGISSDAYIYARRWLELLVLRGGVDRIDMAEFSSFASRQINAWNTRNYKPTWHEDLSTEAIDATQELANRLQTVFEPLMVIANRQSDVPLFAAMEATIKTLEALCADENGDHNALYSGESGEMLRSILIQFLASDTSFAFEPTYWSEIFRAFSSSQLVKPKAGGHPRVSIWGALEARLQSVDFLVLGGLNENVWPQQTSNDPFLTRGMKAKIDMQPPERRIGLAAHDFQMGMGQEAILITRSDRIENAPSVPSRWLQRMETLAGKEATEVMRQRGDRFVSIAQKLETPARLSPEDRPRPTPPIDARPIRFSVTEIERLRRDPYAIYAKKILGLYPMEPLLHDPDVATRGTLIHKILEETTRADIDFASPDAEAAIANIADKVFAEENLPEEIEIIWRARFDAAVPDLIDWERQRQESGVKRFAELQSEPLNIEETGVTLRGRADRLDLKHDGSVDIIDFKTGAPPSAKEVRALLAPQLALEAALLARGGFTEITSETPGELLYIKLGNKGEFDPKDVRGKGKDFIDADTLSQRAWQKLADLMRYYGAEENGYISRLARKLEHDYSDEYDHLARVMEWSSGVDGERGDG